MKPSFPASPHVLRTAQVPPRNGSPDVREGLVAARGQQVAFVRQAANDAVWSSARQRRRLTAIVCADVAGYSRLMSRDEERTFAELKGHTCELIEPAIAEHGGRIVKSTGDGLLIDFASVVDAVRCAVDLQRGMEARNRGVSSQQQIRFRIGINVGDVIVDGDDIFGDAVNVAARLQALAEPGGICASRAVRDHVSHKFCFAFEDLGSQQVKNIAHSVDVYRIRAGTAADTFQSRTCSSCGAHA